MDLELSDSQVALRDSFCALLEREAGAGRARACEPLGFDSGLWERLRSVGVPGMAVPTEAGGDGAPLDALAVVAEQMGAHLAPVPFTESVVSARLLASAGAIGPSGAPGALGAGVLDGTRIATLALQPFGERPDLVPAGAVAAVVAGMSSGRLVAWRPVGNPPHVANLACLPLARLRPPPDATVLCRDAREGARLFDIALREWETLTAASLTGLARRALDLAVDYVTSRHQFGVPIGSFQAVQHRLADLATAVDGVAMLVQEAAWSATASPQDAPALSSMAFVAAARAAEDAAATSLHLHGGYGYMLEYDIQLYLRRAKGWALVRGDPRDVLRRVAELRYVTDPATAST